MDVDEKNKIGLIDENDFYILYHIEKIQKDLPLKSNKDFNKKIRKSLVNKSKYEFNNDLIKKITEKKFTQSDFEKLATSSLTQIESSEIISINDSEKFTNDSVKYLYSLSKNSFTVIADNNNNIYLAKVKDVYQKEISSFIYKLKDSENKFGYITKNFFELDFSKKYKFCSGPFTQKLFQIISLNKNYFYIDLGNFKTFVDRKKTNFVPIWQNRKMFSPVA